MMAEGYSAAQLITQFHDDLVTMESITDKQKAVIMERLAVSTVMLFIQICSVTH